MKVLFTSTKTIIAVDVEIAVTNAIVETGNSIFSWTDEDFFPKDLPAFGSLRRGLEQIDLLVADLSKNNADIMLEIGFAKAMALPVIVICNQEDLGKIIAPELGITTLFFDRRRLNETLISPLKQYLTSDGFTKFKVKEQLSLEKIDTSVKTIFVSYNHVDNAYIERLRIHFKPFEKRGLVDLWSDRKINAGEKWKEKIERALEKSVVAILMVSADFLASDFITDNELPAILKGAQEKGKIILPVIVKPCRFTKDENLSIFQSINDPKLPLSKMDESQREEVYVKIADDIYSLLK